MRERAFRADAFLFEAFCRAVLLVRTLDDFTEWEKAARLLASLAVRLRLTPSSRYDARSAGRRVQQAPRSFYEFMEDVDAVH